MARGSACLPTHRTTQTEYTQTSMSRVGFEPTTPALELGKKVHALDRAVTVIGDYLLYKTFFVSLYGREIYLSP
jgi:hypothetical protein